VGIKDEQIGRRKGWGRDRGASGRGRDASSEFINRELDKEETEKYRVWRDEVSDVFDRLQETVESGYKLSVKYDDYGECFAAYLIPGEDSNNSGFILAGRGGTPYRAIAECLYKHTFIFHEEWGADDRRQGRGRDSDF